MRLFVIALLLLSSTLASAQTKPLDSRSDTAFWWRWKLSDARRLHLPNLAKTTDRVHFRYWMNDQLIECWSQDSDTFKGLIVSFAERVSYRSNNATRGVDHWYNSKTVLPPGQAKEIYELFRELQIFDLPTDKQIKGWSMGLDGDEYLVEYATSNTYALKAYWTPSAQRDVPSADSLLALNKRLQDKLHLEEL